MLSIAGSHRHWIDRRCVTIDISNGRSSVVIETEWNRGRASFSNNRQKQKQFDIETDDGQNG